MDTSGFDIQFDNHIPENGYRIEGYLCNANALAFFCRCGTGNKDGSYCLNANL